MDLVTVVNRIVSPLRTRIMSIIGKGIIESVDDSTGIQTTKISMLADEVRSDVDRLQDYGFTSNPPPESDAVYAAIGGGKDNLVILKVDSATYRLTTLDSGEVAIYSKWCGETKEHCIILKKDKSIEIHGSKVKSFCDLEVDGDLVVTGNIEASGSVKGSEIIVGLLPLSTHVHATGTGPSGPPQGPPAPPTT